MPELDPSPPRAMDSLNCGCGGRAPLKRASLHARRTRITPGASGSTGVSSALSRLAPAVWFVLVPGVTGCCVLCGAAESHAGTRRAQGSMVTTSSALLPHVCECSGIPRDSVGKKDLWAHPMQNGPHGAMMGKDGGRRAGYRFHIDAGAGAGRSGQQLGHVVPRCPSRVNNQKRVCCAVVLWPRQWQHWCCDGVKVCLRQGAQHDRQQQALHYSGWALWV